MTTTTDRVIDSTARPPRAARAGSVALAAIWLVGAAGLWWTLTPTPSHLLTNLLATYLLGWGGVAMLARGPSSRRKTLFALMTGAIGLVFARGASIGNFHLLAPAVYVLAALSLVTVGQRIWHVRKELATPATASGD